MLPVIGMGTWITFDAGPIPAARQNLLPVLQAFFDGGGALIDSSPMYGSAESVVGELLPQVRRNGPLFSATKVWTPGRALGISSMERSRQLWDVPRFDLIQIHNMLDWQTHLETLQAMKAAGKVRYIGITTSHGARHDAMERVMAREPFDFVQFTYNLADRSVERRLLPLAAERRLGVIINRPFDGGALFRAVRGKALPDYARDIGVQRVVAVLPEVRRLAPGGNVRDSGHIESRAHGREHGRVARTAAGCRHAPSDGRDVRCDVIGPSG